VTAEPDPRAQLPLILTIAGVLGIGGLVGFALAPALLTYSPLLLIVLAPFGRHLVLAAPVTEFVPFLLVATGRRVITCTLAYLVGRAYGKAGIAWVEGRYPRAARPLLALQWLFRRAGPLVLLVAPGPIVCALSGATRMRWLWFLPIATAGQLFWVGVTYRVGEALQAFILPILEWLQDNMLATTLACVVLAVGFRLLRRGGRAVDALPPLPGSVASVAGPGATPPTGGEG
jgi:membrane protein DedA with SNARE-associated domain